MTRHAVSWGRQDSAGCATRKTKPSSLKIVVCFWATRSRTKSAIRKWDKVFATRTLFLGTLTIFFRPVVTRKTSKLQSLRCGVCVCMCGWGGYMLDVLQHALLVFGISPQFAQRASRRLHHANYFTWSGANDTDSPENAMRGRCGTLRRYNNNVCFVGLNGHETLHVRTAALFVRFNAFCIHVKLPKIFKNYKKHLI